MSSYAYLMHYKPVMLIAALPENWKVGEPVIVPPPKTAAAADARKAEGYEYTDWYFSKKTL